MENKKLYTISIKGWEESILGVIESFSKKWVLIKRISNMYTFDGFTLIQRRHIKFCRREEGNKFKEKVLAANGIMNMPIPEIPIDDRFSPIQWLCDHGKVVEFHVEDESKFYVGRIEKVQMNVVRWISIDNRGIWDTTPGLCTLYLKTIVYFDINSNYVDSLIAYNQAERSPKDRLYLFEIKGWEDIFGVVCAVSAEWVLVKQIINDFRYNGFVLIRSKYIIRWGRDGNIPFREEVIKKLGIMDISVPDIPLNDLTSPFLWLAQQKEFLSLSHKKELDPYLGEIMKIKKHKIEYHTMTPKGVWKSAYWTCPMNDVCFVEWKTDYINSLLAYNKVCSLNNS